MSQAYFEVWTPGVSQLLSMGACYTDFLTKCSLSELIFGPNLGFLNWILADFQAWEHEKLPNLGIFSGKFENVVIFG